jgi:tRNA (guanine10-N2)-dimethyltransferase
MEIAFILSKEHPTLPLAEIKSVMAAEEIKYSIMIETDGLVVLNIADSYYGQIKAVAQRLSLTHEIFKIFITTSAQDMQKKIEDFCWEDYVRDSYAVRFKKLDKKTPINTLTFEKELGTLIKRKINSDIRVDLEDPSIFIRAVSYAGEIYIGVRIAAIHKKHFYELKPHKRPFFYPGSMSPKLARCMVNLTRIRREETLLDPFCGTGGILIEAGIVGAKLIGTDLDPKMVEGTRENLSYCGFNDWNVFKADARKLILKEKVDAVVTDPPYGISASTRGEKSENLYQQSLASLENIIKEGGLFCLATPHYLDINAVLNGTKFIIIEQHHIRMHKSLTRVISVLKKSS